MKILVDEMPTHVEDCPWSYPTENPWNDQTTWFCQWALSNGETCPVAKGSECPYFKQNSTKLKNVLEMVYDSRNQT